jgi:hypothetical protein
MFLKLRKAGKCQKKVAPIVMWIMLPKTLKGDLEVQPCADTPFIASTHVTTKDSATEYSSLFPYTPLQYTAIAILPL